MIATPRNGIPNSSVKYEPSSQCILALLNAFHPPYLPHHGFTGLSRSGEEDSELDR
jgi:hypothetical protein